jgi:xanthine dehydrogenase YagR molybdenum-binding subunit
VAAAAVRGVLTILTHENAERLCSDEDKEFWVLQSPELCFRGQFVAVIVADSAEAGREAAELVEVSYDEHDHDVVRRVDHPDLYVPEQVNPTFPTDTEEGDVEAELASAAALSMRTTPRRPTTTIRWSRTPRSPAGIREPSPSRCTTRRRASTTCAS